MVHNIGFLAKGRVVTRTQPGTGPLCKKKGGRPIGKPPRVRTIAVSCGLGLASGHLARKEASGRKWPVGLAAYRPGRLLAFRTDRVGGFAVNSVVTDL